MSHTDFPMAPAKWATEVSTAITKSKLAISAAVSSHVGFLGRISNITPLFSALSGPTCRETKRQSHSKIGFMFSNRMDFLRPYSAIHTPSFLMPEDQHRPTF